MMNTVKISRYTPLVILFALFLTACSTGIEGTRTITMSRSERKETMPGAEELLAGAMTSGLLKEWLPGKKFVVTDSKASLLLESQSASQSQADSTLRAGTFLAFERIVPRQTPGGDTVVILEFRSDHGIYQYNTARSLKAATSELSGRDMPMMIDLDMVSKADSLLRGRRVWTLSRLWYDKTGNTFDGRKFEAVEISGVRPGNMVFPFAVDFIDEEGRCSFMYMNTNSSGGIGAESRTFPSLFTLSDPKLKYPSVAPEVWEYIRKGRVALGMTKEECRLSLGNPTEVDAGHDWSSVIDVWGYRDGTYLQFQDGLLINYRH